MKTPTYGYVGRCRTCYPLDRPKHYGAYTPTDAKPNPECEECSGKGKIIILSADVRSGDNLLSIINKRKDADKCLFAVP